MTGEDVEVDKSLIEILDAPLIHMVRNAADHGIELPDKRAAGGKPKCGTISVRVEEEEKFIVLSVKDDGAGLNYDGIQRKAEALGIVQPGQKLTQSQVVDLLFQAGVSTAEQVTDISGRGVGMDVVKRAIEGSGGTITVASEAGKGSTFTVKMGKSVTTHIVESLVFSVNRRFYAVPVERVIEVFSCVREDVTSAGGRDRFICRHDSLIPVVPAANVLSTGAEVVEPYHGENIIAVRANGRRMALLVDQVLAVQQVVLKEVRNLKVKGDAYCGAALIGDGDIALLLDLDKFCAGYDEARLAERSRVVGSTAAGAQRAAASDNVVTDTFLLAQAGGNRQIAIPLRDVSRLEKLERTSVERAAGRTVIQYRDAIMPLYSLTKEIGGEAALLNVVVTYREQQPIGIVVDSILDIISESVEVEQLGDSSDSAVYGTGILRSKVTDLISVSELLNHGERYRY